MKNLKLTCVLVGLIFTQIINAQNIGIGTNTPSQKLDVNGALKVGISSSGTNGTIQYDGSDLQGYTKGKWKSLTEEIPSGTIIMTDSKNDSLLNDGYQYYGYYNYSGLNLADSSQMWNSPNIIDPTYSNGYKAIYSGEKVLTFGVSSNSFDGGIYDPVSETWDTMTSTNKPSSRNFAHTVWTGTEFIVWGGYSGSTVYKNGARYNPTNDTWTTMSITNAPDSSYYSDAVWTGTEMIVWGGQPINSNNAGKYNPTTDTWSSISSTGAPSPRWGHSMVWTGTEVLVWGGYNSSPLNDGARYNPSTNTWTPITSTGAPGARYDFAYVWTGDKLIIWSGHHSGTNYWTDGFSYDPILNQWSSISTVNAPFQRKLPAVTWTGENMVVVSGYYGTGVVGGGALYNPTSDTWTTITSTGMPIGFYMEAVTAGDFVIVIKDGRAYEWCQYCGTTSQTKTMYLYQKT